MKDQIRHLIEQIIPICSSFINKGSDGLYSFVDPIDGEEISAHYGATHAATAFILWGKYVENEEVYKRGIELLKSILKRWNQSKTLPAFHFDFNNFALCLAEPHVDEDMNLEIRNVVNETEDSNHFTINWLPMRWYVNKKRFEWSNDKRYLQTANQCKKIISDATNADGGIEDRLPHGMSFNLQYDVATVAVLQHLRVNGEQYDLSKELGFLLNAVAPDGDINYQGRGANQVFAWGLWIYLLATSGQTNELKNALDYFSPRLEKMLEHNNMMLNEWNGSEKYLWWDYHYASVYIAHCLLWLVLALMEFDKAKISAVIPNSAETGLHIQRTSNYFASWFEGRTEYLAEKGPAIAAIWAKKYGMIYKGAFAPWQGPFGNKYIYEDVIFKNYCGLLEIKRNKDWSKNRYFHKLFPKKETAPSLRLTPLFLPITIQEKDGSLEIVWNNNEDREMIFNLPSLRENGNFELYIDGKESSIFCTEAIKNQYGWVYLSQSRCIRAKEIKLAIK